MTVKGSKDTVSTFGACLPCLSQCQAQSLLQPAGLILMLCLQELLDHLEGMLSNEAVVVTVGQAIVEVKPQVCLQQPCLCMS